MGTRADFYVGRGADAEWLGSIAWDGYPDGIAASVFEAADEPSYRREVADFLNREDGTLPEMGWPWPWEDSGTTDYAYAFDGGVVYGAGFGYSWFVVDLTKENGGEPDEDRPTTKVPFPNMKDRQNVTLGSRSGLLVFGLDR